MTRTNHIFQWLLLEGLDGGAGRWFDIGKGVLCRRNDICEGQREKNAGLDHEGSCKPYISV